MKELRWSEQDEGETITESDISAERLSDAQKWHDKLVETVAASDDNLMEIYLEGGEISVEQIKTAIRNGTINRTFVPFVMGSARHNQGVQPLIDAIVDYLPCPTDVPAAKGIKFKKDEQENIEIPCDVSKMPLGLVFKIQYDREMGPLCYVRMYSGKISSGTQIFNVNKKKRERVNRILRMHADKSEPMDSLSAGDIAVFIGLKLAQTGDTIGSEAFNVLLEQPKFPQPVISVALEPESMSEKDKMNETLAILSREDPTFTSHEDAETGQLIISGMGELHLDVLVTRMRDDFGVKCNVGAPQVTYRESVSGKAEACEEYSRVLAGKENTAGLKISVEQREQGSGNSYEVCCKHSDVPEEIMAAIESGFKSALDSGIKYGYPCTDVGIKVLEITYNELTSTTFAFEACAAQVFDKACNSANPVILEPVMNVDISCPKEFVGPASSQLSQRGGSIMGQDSKVSGEIIHAQAPMANMFGFTTNLRSATQGRASFSMEFSHFQIKAGGLTSY